MAKDFSRDFYNSKAWKKTRNAIIARDLGLCQICKKHPATEVHHIIPLTPENINNPDITLGSDNLISLCHIDHMRQHSKAVNIEYDKNGNILDVYDNYLQDDTNPYDILDEILENTNERNKTDK